jgi:protein-disulfide isomerase/uncharacterized membrane protein
MLKKLMRTIFPRGTGNAQDPVEYVSRKINWATLAFGTAGFAVCVYSFAEYIRIKSSSQLGAGCIIRADSTCGGVAATGYGTVFGVPVVALGVAFWALVITLAVMPKLEQLSNKLFMSLRLAISFFGFLFVLYLYYIAMFVADITCIICSVTQIVSTLFFMFSLFTFLFHRTGILEINLRAMQKFVIIATGVALPLLIIGVGAPAFLEWKRTKPVTITQMSDIDDSFPLEWWEVQGRDDDGNGEDYRAGNDEAKVNIQLFTDPACIECGQAQAAIGSAMESVGADKMLFVVKFFPQDADCNRYAETQGVACRISVAARCAGRQGRFFEYLAWAYEGQEKTAVEQNTLYSLDGLRFQAVRFGLNGSDFTTCMNSTVDLVKIRDDVENANKMGAGAAPFMIINGRAFEGDYSNPDEIAAAIRAIQRQK